MSGIGTASLNIRNFVSNHAKHVKQPHTNLFPFFVPPSINNESMLTAFFASIQQVQLSSVWIESQVQANTNAYLTLLNLPHNKNLHSFSFRQEKPNVL
jgi:hypothetical protein